MRVFCFDYRHNKTGQRTQLAEADGSVTTWAYDPVYQVTRHYCTSTQPGASLNITLSYDGGNPTVEVTPTERTTSTYDVLNRLQVQKSTVGIATYSYDASGQRTRKYYKELASGSDAVSTYVWDEDHRLQAVQTGGALVFGTITSYSYNGNGLRFSREGTWQSRKYIWNGQALAAETDADNVPQLSYQQAPGGFGQLVSRYDGNILATSYPLMDGLGSLRQMTDQNQMVAGSPPRYDPFGKVVGGGDATLNLGAKVGYYYDADTGMYYLRQRWYDPAGKQFVSADPLGVAGGDVNLYRYVKNNPVNNLDPDGQKCGGDDYGYSPMLAMASPPSSSPPSTRPSPPSPRPIAPLCKLPSPPTTRPTAPGTTQPTAKCDDCWSTCVANQGLLGGDKGAVICRDDGCGRCPTDS
jgi:RHS repeat-associated protein